MTAFVIGVGMTRFTKWNGIAPETLGGRAVLAALDDAGIERPSVEAAFCGSVQGGVGIGQRVLAGLNMTGIPITNVEAACASGGSALREAMMWVDAGAIDVGLVLGIDILTATTTGPIKPVHHDPRKVAVPIPGIYALTAARYLHDTEVTARDLAAVAVKNRANGAENKFAHFRTRVTLEEVLASPLVAEPFTRLQCCPNVDGAAAAIVCSEAAVRRLGSSRAIRIAGGALLSGRRADRTDAIRETTKRTAKLAYEAAGVGPEDLDLCEVHEPFTISEPLHAESLGLCAAGEGGRYISDGHADIHGDGVAVNTSGGLIARGHPLGASGLAQIHEVVTQLRGDAGARQVPGARVGLTHIFGGSFPEIEGDACSVHILTT
ncbi:thiolase family protein [Rhodococcus sp. NPDC057014]|uniref:thiolase family protein n=1 Tax=Rhodococcus sp. NPDC057014 TaxID=3346000 RepID=UPI0036401E63